MLAGGIQVTFGDGRHQLVDLELFEHESEELVRFYTTIGTTIALSDVRMNASLRLNAELAHGALAIRADRLVMVDTISLADATASEIQGTVGYLAEMADFYEKQLFGTDDY